jgi:hypothetical protein
LNAKTTGRREQGIQTTDQLHPVAGFGGSGKTNQLHHVFTGHAANNRHRAINDIARCRLRTIAGVNPVAQELRKS